MQAQTARLAERISRLAAHEASPAVHLARRIHTLQRHVDADPTPTACPLAHKR
jgi:hypothetical protein